MKTIPPPLPSPSFTNLTPSRILGLSGLIPPQQNPNKPLGVAQCDLSTLFPLLKSFGGKASIFSLLGTFLVFRVSQEIVNLLFLGSFFSIYNNIHHPSKLAVGADFYCFKHKIEPKWEDPICANGGKWTANYQRAKSDTSWLYTV